MKFRNFDEADAAVTKVKALEAAAASQENDLVRAALTEQATRLRDAFAVKPRAPKAAKPQKLAAAGGKK